MDEIMFFYDNLLPSVKIRDINFLQRIDFTGWFFSAISSGVVWGSNVTDVPKSIIFLSSEKKITISVWIKYLYLRNDKVTRE